MIIGKKKLESLKKMPYIETLVTKSKDGKWMINKTTITSIKPVEYFETILENEGEIEVEATNEEMVSEELQEEIKNAKKELN